MPKSWPEVVASPQYQALPPDQQETARAQYFDAVVAPRVPPEHLEEARQQFRASAASVEKTVPDAPRLSIGDSFVEGFGGSDDARRRFIAAKLLPDMPLDQAVTRVRKIDGNWSYSPDGQSWLPAMGRGAHNIVAKAASAAGDVIPAVTGLAGAVVGGVGAGPLGAIAGGGSLAGAGEVARQKIGQRLMGPAIADQDIKSGPVMEQALLGEAGGIGGGGGKLAADAADLAATKATGQIKRARALQAKAADLGVPLSVGEVTGDAALLKQQEALGNRMATGLQVAGWDAARNRKVVSAAKSMVADLGSSALDPALAGHLEEMASHTPGQLAALRRSIEGSAPEMWPALKRAYVDQLVGSGLFQGEKANAASKLAGALSDKETLAKLKAVLTDAEWSGFNDLAEVARAAAQVKSVSIDATQIAKAAAGHVKGHAVGYIAGHATGLGAAIHTVSFGRFLSTLFSGARAQKLLEIILSGDPEALRALKSVKDLTPGSEAWRVAMGSLAGRVGVTAADLSEPSSEPTRKAGGRVTAPDPRARVGGGVAPVTEAELHRMIAEQAHEKASPALAAIIRGQDPIKLGLNATAWGPHLVSALKADPQSAAMIKELGQLRSGSVQWRIIAGHLAGQAADASRRVAKRENSPRETAQAR